MNIRNYKESDYEMLKDWWVLQSEFPPTREMLPEESTYILEEDGFAVVSITLYLTNSKEFCILDNFIKNPFLPCGKEKSAAIIEYAEKQAKELGYKSIMCMALKDKLKEYYPIFGYVKRCDNISSFNKELV